MRQRGTVAEANDRVDERADVFALGAILCEILTGRPAYVGRTDEEVFRKAIRAGNALASPDFLR